MPTVNITYNSGTNTWQANPPSQGFAKSQGITFNIGNIPSGKTGVRLCFSNTAVFGVSFLEYTTSGNKSPNVTGALNASSPYHCQDAGTTCVPQSTATEPFDVTITSTPFPKKKKKKQVKAAVKTAAKTTAKKPAKKAAKKAAKKTAKKVAKKPAKKAAKKAAKKK
jgi:hypothetical protein